MIGAVTGLSVAVAVSTVSVWQLAILLGWIAGTGTIVSWVWMEIAPLDAKTTAAVSTRVDASRRISRTVLLGASLGSLIAVIAAFREAKVSGGITALVLTSAAMLAIISAWLTVQIVFTLHYAHLYYREPPGGVDFPGLTTGPSYRDFAYLSFTIGMTFQVSDTPVRDPEIRHMVLRHALLSFVFGTAIIAGAINLLAGLIG